MNYTFHFRDVFAAHDALASGLLVTFQLTASTIFFGFIIGLAVAIGSVYGSRRVKALTYAYVELIRNTPLIVQLFVVFFGLPSVGLKFDVMTVSTIGLAINLGAYASEIIRAGIESIPKTQIEAGLTLGLTRPQIFRYVVLFPALKNVYPSLCSQFILLMLATSVASQIAAPELFYAGSIIESRTYRDFEVYTVIAVLYLAIAIVLRGMFATFYQLMFATK